MGSRGCEALTYLKITVGQSQRSKKFVPVGFGGTEILKWSKGKKRAVNEPAERGAKSRLCRGRRRVYSEQLSGGGISWWGGGGEGPDDWTQLTAPAGRSPCQLTSPACLPSTLNSTELSAQRNCSYAIISEIPLFLEITIVVTLVLWKFSSSTSHSRIRMFVKCNLRIRK